MDLITITPEKYKCLRGHLDAIEEILRGCSVGSAVVSYSAPKPKPKENKTEKINKYKNLIGSGQRVKKPNHLKK